MRVGSILSLIFHVAIVLLLLFGLPDLFASDEMVIEPVPVAFKVPVRSSA